MIGQLAVRVIASFTVLLVAFGAHAQDDAHTLQTTMNFNTSMVSASEDSGGFALAARSVLFSVVDDANKSNYGLSEADRDAAKLVESGISFNVMEPYINQIKVGLEESKNVEELARLLEQARAADEKAEEQYYRSILAQMSDQGRAVVMQAIDRQMPLKTIAKINFVGVAAQQPDLARALLRQVVVNFEATQSNGTDKGNVETRIDE